MHTHLNAKDIDTASVEQAAVNCPQCGSGKIKPAVVRSAFWHNDRLVVVEDLPALVCTACHEQFYDDATVTILDLARQRLSIVEGQPFDHGASLLIPRIPPGHRY